MAIRSSIGGHESKIIQLASNICKRWESEEELELPIDDSQLTPIEIVKFKDDAFERVIG